MAVKADAYGHGAIPISKVAEEEGIDYLGIATLEEGREIRKGGITIPLLLLGLPVPEEIPGVVHHNIIPVVADRSLISAFAMEAENQGKIVEVHLKVDTGMGRIGCRPEDTLPIIHFIRQHPSLRLGGVCTHFPAADSQDKSFTRHQIKLFLQAISQVKQEGINPGIIHAANSGAIIDLEDAHFNMIRPGILAYGYYPSTEQHRNLPITPVMELATKVVFLKKHPPGTPISYGMTYKTQSQTIIATLPIGYGDGYNRLLSNKGEVVIRHKRYPIIGRICMDQCMVELGIASPVQLYDNVILFGPSGECPDAEELAGKIGTIPYEVTCMVGKRVPRIYIE